MTRISVSARAGCALLAAALTAALPTLAHVGTYTGPAGLPVVALERVVVVPSAAAWAELQPPAAAGALAAARDAAARSKL